MKLYFPAYYKLFHCIAAACPDSCCKEWTVDVDTESAKRYRALPGALGNCLRKVLVDTQDGNTIMAIENDRCPMWRQDSLCRIQAELGHDALCKTCREYPRLRHDYGDFCELGLELSCPEAARLILNTPTSQMSIQTQPGGEDPEYDTEAMEILLSSRREVFSLLENKQYTIPETIAIILLHSHHVQAQLDGADAIPFDPDACLTEARNFSQNGDMASVFSLFYGLEILTDRWQTRLENGASNIQWVPPLNALMVYMVQRYWLQAISDYDLVCRAKFSVVACLLIGAMGDNIIETAQLFSKEIENNPDNVEAILDGAYSSPALTDMNLLSLLLS